VSGSCVTRSGALDSSRELGSQKRRERSPLQGFSPDFGSEAHCIGDVPGSFYDQSSRALGPTRRYGLANINRAYEDLDSDAVVRRVIVF